MSKQATTSTGHVIPIRETVANNLLGDKELLRLASLIGTDAKTPELNFVKYLTTYVMNQANDSYYRGVHLGIAMGRKEAVAMMETVIGQNEQYEELQYPKTDDEGEPLWSNSAIKQSRKQRMQRVADRNELRKEQATRLTQAITAITKATEVPDEQ